MIDKKRRVALVTGASSGIGYALANEFASRGYDLVLVARTEERLRGAAEEFREKWGAASRVVALDLAQPRAAERLFAVVDETGVEVDVLVNNAGYGTFGYMVEQDVERYVCEMQLNVVTTGHLTRLFLERMVERGSGKILNVASIGAFLSGPMFSVYYATKAFVLHLSEALHEEVEGSGVTVTALCPGPTTTEFHQRAAVRDSGSASRRYMTADEVARLAYRGLMRGDALVIPGFFNKLMVAITRFAPRSWVRKRVFARQRRRSAAGT